MEIGDSRVYLADNHRALVVPPESRIHRGAVVDRLYRNTDDQLRINNSHSGLDRKSTIKSITSEYGCDIEGVKNALQKIKDGYPLYGTPVPSSVNILSEEYKVLRNPIQDLKENEDLVTRHKTEEWKEIARENRREEEVRQIVSLIDCLVSVERLRMISVFTGFRREARPKDPKMNSVLRYARLVPPDIVGKDDRLPAIELYGEGIFFTLNETILKLWTEKVNISRANDDPLDRFLNHVSHCPNHYNEVVGTAEFILCHSLSHLVIRQLERNCGYPSASLQERIYCQQEEPTMAGILIYIAVPDRHGSLGGLMQFAEPKKFYRLFSNALKAAQWCSFDPVCSNPEDSKFEQLNGSACHACLMIPESSCCYGNQYLDRNLINGNSSNLPSLIELANH